MKKSILAIIICLMALTALPAMASSDTSSSGNGDAILTLKDEDSFRKRTPSRMIVQLTYEDGRVSIFSDFYIGEFSITFNNIESGKIYYIPSIHLGQSVPIELEYGAYHLTAIAQDETALAGFMQVY